MKKLTNIFALALTLTFGMNSLAEAQTTTETEKKKMSPVLKGGIIGAGTGAAAGAIINKKNRVAGGIVGAAVGGAVGAGVGKVVDNKQKKKAAEEQERMNQLEQVAAANEPVPASTGSERAYAPSKAVASSSYKAKKTTRKVTSSSPKVLAPAKQEATETLYLNGWIPNTGEGDPMVAYSKSEYKRKSW